jgi:hypothetical protein
MLEKRDRVGGNAIMARGFFGCESSVLRQAMVKTDKMRYLERLFAASL